MGEVEAMNEVYLLNMMQIGHYQRQIDACLDDDVDLWKRQFKDKMELWDKVYSGFIQMWAVCDGDCIHAVFMTEITSKPDAVLRIFWAYGTRLLEVIPEVDDIVNAFAREMGCVEIEITGRKGWEKVFRASGAKHVFSVFRRPVRHVKGH